MELLGDAERAVVQEGANAVWLLADRGFPAQQFYEKNGYAVSSRTIFMLKRLQRGRSRPS